MTTNFEVGAAEQRWVEIAVVDEMRAGQRQSSEEGPLMKEHVEIDIVDSFDWSSRSLPAQVRLC